MNSRIFATQFLLIDLSGRRNEKKRARLLAILTKKLYICY